MQALLYESRVIVVLAIANASLQQEP